MGKPRRIVKRVPKAGQKDRVAAIQQDIREQDKVCGGLTREGNLCQKYPGWGTNHPGFGPCKFHGGNEPITSLTVAGSDVTPRYGKYVRAVDAYAELAMDPELKNIDEEIALMRNTIRDIQDTITEVRDRNDGMLMPENPNEAKILLALLKQSGDMTTVVGQLIDRKHKIEEGKIVTFRQVQETLAQVIMIIKRNCDGCASLPAMAEDFRRIDMSKFEPR